MSDAASEIQTQGGAVVQGNVTTSGGDVVNRDKIIGGDEVRGNKYVTVLPGDRPRLFVGVPPMPPRFLGREALVEELVNRLCAGQTTALSADGLPGVGKTTLAVALARHPRILDHFSGGVLWAGLGRTPDVASIQATWGDALETDLRDLLDPYARQQRLNSAIGDQRLLVVLDDVWQWDAAQPLRCSGPHTVTILTTRDQAIARRWAGPQQSVNVPVLAPGPGYDLLYALGPEACDSDPAAARRLAAQVDGLPLALELLGGYLGASSQRRTQARRQQALATLADPAARLALATQRLGDQQHQAVTLQETIALSLADLPAATVAAFYALGAFAPKPARFDLPAALAVTGAEEEALFTLADRNLVEMDADETLALHQTLSALACTQLPTEAITRHQEYYLATVNQDRENWQKIEAFYDQIKYAWTNQTDNDSKLEFKWALRTYQERRGLWQEYMEWAQQCLAIALKMGQAENIAYMYVHIGYAHKAVGENFQALAHYEQALPFCRQVADNATIINNIGVVYDNLGEKQQALAYYEQALLLHRQVANKMGEATILNNLGIVYSGLGNKQQALAYCQQAIDILQQIGDKAGEATALNNLGSIYDDLGEKQQALAYYEQALLLHRWVGDKAGEATTLSNIGLVYSDLGEGQQALAYYEQALTLWRQIGDKASEVTTSNNLVAVYIRLGDKQQALAYYEQALPLRRQIGDKEGEATILNNLGFVYSNLGDKQQALAYYEQALPLWRQVGDRTNEATTLNNHGAVYDALGDRQQALAYYAQALPLRRQVGDKAGEATTLHNLGAVYDALGDRQQALAYYAQALPLQRQVGDRWGESITCYNMAMVYQVLGDLAAAEQYLMRTVELEEASGHPDLASDRAILAQVRAERGGA